MLNVIEIEFLSIVLILVYVGAVMVLFLFVVMMLNIKHEEQSRRSVWLSYLSILTLSLIFFYFTYLYFESAKPAIVANPIEIITTGVTMMNELRNDFLKSSLLIAVIQPSMENGEGKFKPLPPEFN